MTNGHVTDNVELYHPGLTYMQTDLLYRNEKGTSEMFHQRAGRRFKSNT